MWYRVNRLSRLHVFLRRIAYAVLWRLPERIKWPLFGAGLRRKAPYNLLNTGDTVVQVGAPADILRAGRSRAIHFARRVGKSGQVIVIEPDPDNVRALKSFLERHPSLNVVVKEIGAWSSKGELSFMVDRDNPASNVVEQVVDGTRSDLKRFSHIRIKVDTIPNIISGFPVPRLISITANGSEEEILKGLASASYKIPYIATIAQIEETPTLAAMGYEFFSTDNRGFTFWHPAASA